MKVIVSRQLKDGSFSVVGMNDRTIIGPYRSIKRILQGITEYAGGKPARVEWYPGNDIQCDPAYITIVNN